MIKALYLEADGQVTLLGGIPFDWLQQNGTTALRHLRTPAGRVSLVVCRRSPDLCQLTLKAAPVTAGPRRIRFPSHLRAEPMTPGVKAVGDHLFAVSAPLPQIDFRLTTGLSGG
jgi:hypothetical protein